MALTTVLAAPSGKPHDPKLDALSELCGQIAFDINTLRIVLDENVESADVALLACQALSRLGWMAEQAAQIAGHSGPVIGGDADAWMTGGKIRGASNV